jgi:hypothetical protein
LNEIMSPAHFVRVRTTWGGPAPSETGRAIGASRRLLESDRESWIIRREQLDRADVNLKAQVKQL